MEQSVQNKQKTWKESGLKGRGTKTVIICTMPQEKINKDYYSNISKHIRFIKEHQLSTHKHKIHLVIIWKENYKCSDKWI